MVNGKCWIKEGKDWLHLVRRNISGYGFVKDTEQVPTNPKMLSEIYRYYDGRKHEFEYLAMEILSSVNIVVLGQAKCTDPSRATNGRHIA